MADIADITGDRAEFDHLANLSKSRKPEGPAATGRCLFCDDELDHGMRWCNAECRDLWEKKRVS